MSNRDRLSIDSLVVRNPEVIDGEIDGEVVAMNSETGECYGLDLVGSRIWKLMSEAIPVGDVCTKLLAEYEIKRETCERDVLDLLAELHAENLISIVPAK